MKICDLDNPPTRGTFSFHNVAQLAKLVENGFRAEGPPETQRMIVNLRADTPFGPFGMATSVRLSHGNAGFIHDAKEQQTMVVVPKEKSTAK